MHIRKSLVLFSLVCLLSLGMPAVALAQDSAPPEPQAAPLVLFTTYPSEYIGLGESVSMTLKVRAGTDAQTVHLELQDLPDGWDATFRGGGKIVDAVFADPGTDSSIDLKIDPPADVAAGTYTMTVVGRGNGTQAELPISITVREKLPPRMSLTSDLPTIKGAPSSPFNFSVKLVNEGDEDLSVNLNSLAPAAFLVKFTTSGQEVTDLPLSAGESKTISVQATPISDVQAGKYPITMQAQSDEASASLDLFAEVTGEQNLVITAPDGRLSGQANAGKETPFKIVLDNQGSAPAQGIEMSSSAPSGWTVDFAPALISEIPAGQQVEVTANVLPVDKAIAGDYVVTIRAKPAEGQTKSADFRITVLTSTLWGVVGIALIAVAVGVVAIAVLRFGRR